jgi:hypothetical protein
MSADPVEWEELNEKQVAAFASVTALLGSTSVERHHPRGDMSYLANPLMPGIQVVADYEGNLDVWRVDDGEPHPVAFDQPPEKCAWWLTPLKGKS